MLLLRMQDFKIYYRINKLSISKTKKVFLSRLKSPLFCFKTHRKPSKYLFCIMTFDIPTSLRNIEGSKVKFGTYLILMGLIFGGYLG